MLSRAAAVPAAVVAASVIVLAVSPPQTRIDRAVAIATARLDEWLGPLPAPAAAPAVSQPLFDAASSMTLESEVAFELARARLKAVGAPAIVDGIAWHLQSRIVAELFDLEFHQPGHHADEIRVFGDSVPWGIPSLALPSRARDARAPRSIGHAADAVATLENIVGWPALAGALRVVAASTEPLDAAAFQARLESALGVPVGWFVAAVDSGVHINYAIAGVDSREDQCGTARCYRTTIDVSREGAVLFPDSKTAGALRLAIDLEFESGAPSTLMWDGVDAAHRFTVESGAAPVAVRLDPERRIRLDENWHDQQWRAGAVLAPAPIKSLAAWLVWLQNAALTCGVLL